ncbi:sulfite exporter TauE/SafE family protein [Rufibacter latericius]|uniref:Probable membrane transporter protein n=1 Tax=Rufibacter latericius TaxID=2487040 RepID=A0A3M9MZN7_9BACT|nr:sulfite exporter TauE/SafE family protein [Rufibacter latericius]RNI30587.1 sulfite exporter TauE/SafE family protein [Rufibacter latericius]
MDWNLLLLIGCFFLIATLYSSVGFGGGSSYLALLALFLPNFQEIKSTALLCNLVVVSSGSYLFLKEGLFDRKKFLPLVFCSVPAAFLGATFHLTQGVFFLCLGAVLAFSGALLVLQFFTQPVAERVQYDQHSRFFNVFLGTSSGFVSGLVGIGGGILLSPVLHLLRWADARTIAALASFFILVNSIAGLLGQVAAGNFHVDSTPLFPLLIAVFLGGQLGTRVSLKKIKPQAVKGLTGVFVLFIGLKLVFTYL